MIQTYMQQLAQLDPKIAEARAALEASVEAERLANLIADRDRVVAELKASASCSTGVVETPFGKVGHQSRTTVVYPVQVVRDLVPTIAPNVIKTIPASETVDRVALERSVKAAIKALTVPPNMLERLLERADVKTTQAWICQPQLPAATAEITPDAPFTCDAPF